MADQQRTTRFIDNTFVTMFSGSGRRDLDSGRIFTTWVNKVGNYLTHWSNGAYTQVISGPSHEIVHRKPESVQEEMIGKLIHAENGDIVLIAEGNIKLKAKNILLEATDASPGGNVDIIGNGLVTVRTDEEIRIHGGNTVIAGESKCFIDGGAFTYMAGDVKNTGHPNVVGAIQNIIAGNWTALITDVSNAIRGGGVNIV